MNIDGSIIGEIGPIAALNIAGFYIKRFTEVPNKWIPHILLGIGILMECQTSGFSVGSIIKGALVSASAVGSHQIFKNSTPSGEKPGDQPPQSTP